MRKRLFLIVFGVCVVTGVAVTAMPLDIGVATSDVGIVAEGEKYVLVARNVTPGYSSFRKVMVTMAFNREANAVIITCRSTILGMFFGEAESGSQVELPVAREGSGLKKIVVFHDEVSPQAAVGELTLNEDGIWQYVGF